MMDYDRDQLIEGFEYLDDLRLSGRTNMFGAAPYVERELGYTKNEARNITLKWMETFDGQSTVEQRVEKVMSAT
jgi:hypothetical protein